MTLWYDFVEFFGGSGRVSQAASKMGLVVAPPLDLDASCHYNLAEPRLIEWICPLPDGAAMHNLFSCCTPSLEEL